MLNELSIIRHYLAGAAEQSSAYPEEVEDACERLSDRIERMEADIRELARAVSQLRDATGTYDDIE